MPGCPGPFGPITNPMRRRGKTAQKLAAFTLIEVMITMFLISLMCLGVFAGLQQITRGMLTVAARNEGYHLMQAEAERLLASDYSGFTATSADQSITSALKTSFLSYKPVPQTGSVAALDVTSDNNTGRITFTRRVVSVASTSSSRTLRVEVEWRIHPSERFNQISTVLFRTQ